MKSELKNVRLKTNLNQIPNGTYSGEWSGYQVSFTMGGIDYEAEAETGIRGMSKCFVSIANGQATVVAAN